MWAFLVFLISPKLCRRADDITIGRRDFPVVLVASLFDEGGAVEDVHGVIASVSI